MTTTHKTASGVLTTAPPGGLTDCPGIYLTNVKRKRIEEWCTDVAQHLKAGSLCRSVIGHPIEDNRLPSGVSDGGGVTNCTPRSALSAGGAATTTTALNAVAESAAPGLFTDTATEMPSPGSRKVDQNWNAVTTFRDKHDKGDKNVPPVPASRGAAPLPSPSKPLPVAKLSNYNHDSEQRKRIDRLVQGLPVFSSPAASTGSGALDRLTSGTNGASAGVTVYVNGEETWRGSSRERQVRSLPPARHLTPGPPSNSRSSSAEPRQHQQQRGPSRHPPASRHRNASPSRWGRAMQKDDMNVNVNFSHHRGKVTSSEIVVVEDNFDLDNHNGQSKQYGSSKYRGMDLRSWDVDLPSTNIKRPLSKKVTKKGQRKLAAGTG